MSIVYVDTMVAACQPY